MLFIGGNVENINLQNNNTEDNNTKITKDIDQVLSNPFMQGKAFKFLLMLMAIFGGCFIIFICLFQVVYKPIMVAGYSMQPTINAFAVGSKGTLNTDTVYYQSVSQNSISSMDIIIVNANYGTEGHSIIKRVIALPGQTISFATYDEKYVKSDGKIYQKYECYVDGIKLDESYIKDGYMEFLVGSVTDVESFSFYNEISKKLTLGLTFSYTLGEDEYFIMGDNRNNSTDSRYFGPIKYDDIIGKVKIHVPYGKNLAQVIWQMIFS